MIKTEVKRDGITKTVKLYEDTMEWEWEEEEEQICPVCGAEDSVMEVADHKNDEIYYVCSECDNEI